MSFNHLDLSPELTRAIADEGYQSPTPVQSQAIPPILKGQDVMVSAQTGTGKTAGFTLPLLQRLNDAQHKPNTHQAIRALILTPTRELAAQVLESVQTYGKYLPYKSTVVFGGVKINPQITKLRRGIDVLVATPGRLLDLVNQGEVQLSKIELFVLDEADRMLDMGFIHDIRKVMKLLPQKRQNLLFSATFSPDIKKLAAKILTTPTLIEIAKKTTTAERIKQVVYPVDRQRKRELLSYIIGSRNWQQVLVFMRTKHGANRLVKQLTSDGLSSAAIHGNKSQSARTKALADFKQGNVRVLVATDIAARGLDIEKLPHVVNYELPNVPEDYVHRVGRTGRASSDGEAVSLISSDEANLLKSIEKLLHCKIKKEVIPGYEPNPDNDVPPVETKRKPGPKRNVKRHKARDTPPSRKKRTPQRSRRT